MPRVRGRHSGGQVRPGKGAAGSGPALEPSGADTERVQRLLVRYQLTIRRRWPVLLLSLVSMFLLTLCFEPFNCWWLTWVALLPWVVAVATAARWGWMLFCSWLAGFLFFAVNLYWLLFCGFPGPLGDMALMALAQLALSAYMGLYFLLFAYVVGGLVRRWSRPGKSGELPVGVPSGLLMTYLVPIAWVGTEVLRGYVLSGFPWFLLGHALARQTTLIQVADLAGAYAVSFLAAAANGLLADGMLLPLFLPTRKGPRPNYQFYAATLALMGLVLLTIVYGRFRVHQFDSPEHWGPRLAVIQRDERITLSGQQDPNDLVARYLEHVDLSARAAESTPRPDLVAWPETMVPFEINDEFLRLSGRGLAAEVLDLARTMDREIAEQAAANGVALLVGASSLVPEPPGWADRRTLDWADLTREPVGQPGPLNPQMARFNSAILYQPVLLTPTTGPATTPAVNVAKTRYDKRHLVPFGELIPFRRSWPQGFRLLRKLTPMSLLQAGTGPRQLTLMTRTGRTFRLAVPICYEDVMPQAVRTLVYDPDGAKRADFLVNISNDGWFGGTTELKQHWASAVFRCVENRVPMARSVNCGCSGFIDSLGRPMGRLEPGAVGHLAAVLPLDDRVALYSRVGDTPGFACVGLLFAGWAVVIIRRRRARRTANKAGG